MRDPAQTMCAMNGLTIGIGLLALALGSLARTGEPGSGVGVGARSASAAQVAPPPWQSWQELASNAGRYRVRYQLEKSPPPRGESFGLSVYVLDAAGKTVRTDVALLPDADMPEHGHGMTRVPAVKRQPDGRLDASGLRLHMPGRWQIYLDLVEGPHTERAQFDLELE